MNKRILKYIIISFMCSLFVSIAYFFTDIGTETKRNGEEYVVSFLDGQIFEQDVMLHNTPRLDVDVLTAYDENNDGGGTLNIHYM